MRHVHFIAIAGTGMGSLAGLMKGRGYEVTGSDQAIYPPMSTALADWGIPVTEGFRAENVLARRPDLVIVGNAVRPDNPEACAARDAGLVCSTFPDALYEHAIRGKHSVVVAGTHGKTTTTSLIAALLLEVGRDPSLLVGGIAANFDGSFRDGAGPEFVVEGDEYDTAYFDKTPKFLHYHPKTLVITSIEFDHADIYHDLEEIQQQFRLLVAGMPGDGSIVAASDAESVGEVLRDAPCRVIPYGVDGQGPGFRAAQLRASETHTSFTLVGDGQPLAEARIPLHGRHNVANAVAALAVASVLGVESPAAAAALLAYRGVKRRQELRGEVAGVTLIDDFAHHPTAVRETLAAMGERYPGRRLIAVFEPRSNTSRRALFQEDYARSLAGADHVVISRVEDTPIYSATGEVTERLSAERLAEDLGHGGTAAVALSDVDAIVEHLVAIHAPGDVMVTLSNGSFGAIWPKLLERLAQVREG